MKVGELELDRIYTMDCVEGMKQLPDNSIDLVVTSPPYDDLRNYQGFHFDFEATARELYRVMKPTGVVVWVVGDKVKDGNRTLTSFKQALFFQEVGFKVHDVMIYKKKNTPFMRSNAYTNCYEFMFVLAKNKVTKFHPIVTKTARHGVEPLVANKKADGVNKKVLGKLNEEKTLTNIWEFAVGLGGSTNDKIAFKHPAIFPERLAEEHIVSWTDENDIVMDPFMGSGTTAKMAKLNHRHFIGFEISQEYTSIAEERLQQMSPRLF